MVVLSLGNFHSPNVSFLPFLAPFRGRSHGSSASISVYPRSPLLLHQPPLPALIFSGVFLVSCCLAAPSLTSLVQFLRWFCSAVVQTITYFSAVIWPQNHGAFKPRLFALNGRRKKKKKRSECLNMASVILQYWATNCSRRTLAFTERMIFRERLHFLP